MLLRLIAIGGLLLLLAGCETTSFGLDPSATPRKFPCASVTNQQHNYNNNPVQVREQLEAQPAPMC